MRTELPVCKRCCFCLPLRYGLILWVYLKLIVDLMLVMGLLFSIYMSSYGNHRIAPGEIAALIAFMTVLTGDIVLNSLFIVGAHKKHLKILRVYYIYCVVLWAVAVTLLILVHVAMIRDLSRFVHQMLILTIVIYNGAVSFIYIVLQTYFILLIRSEIIKLSNIGNFQFVNNAMEAECSLKIEYGYTEEDINSNSTIEENKTEDDHEIKQCVNTNGTCGTKACCKFVLNEKNSHKI